MQKKFKTILKHCEMPDCNFHAMRHGFATACLEKGIDCKTVSAILGHASTRTTMDIYVHTSLRQKQDCIDAIDRALKASPISGDETQSVFLMEQVDETVDERLMEQP